MFSNEDHLRVTKVKTTDGINPVYNDQNQQVKKVVELPLTSKKLIEEQNALLPNQLKMKVEVVKAYTPAPVTAVINEPVPDTQVIDLQKKIAELEARNKELESKPKKPMGRPKKVKPTENEI